MTKVRTVCYYEASDGKQFASKDLAEAYQDNLEALVKLKVEYETNVRKLQEKEDREWYGDV